MSVIVYLIPKIRSKIYFSKSRIAHARGSMGGGSKVETWTRMLSFSLRISPHFEIIRVWSTTFTVETSLSLVHQTVALVDYASKLSAPREVVKTSSLRASCKIHAPPSASRFTAIDPRERETRYTPLLPILFTLLLRIYLYVCI